RLGPGHAFDTRRHGLCAVIIFLGDGKTRLVTRSCRKRPSAAGIESDRSRIAVPAARRIAGTLSETATHVARSVVAPLGAADQITLLVFRKHDQKVRDIGRPL